MVNATKILPTDEKPEDCLDRQYVLHEEVRLWEKEEATRLRARN